MKVPTIDIIDICISAIYCLSFFIASLEIKKLKSFRIFSLVMFLFIVNNILITTDLIRFFPVRFLITPFLDLLVAISLLISFDIIRQKRVLFILFLSGVSVIVLIAVLLFLSGYPDKIPFHLINLIAALPVKIAFVVLFIISVKELFRYFSLLLLFRALMLFPVTAMALIDLFDAVTASLGYINIIRYDLILRYSPVFTVALGISFTLEGTGIVINNLHIQSETDELTNIPNRRHFISAVKTRLASGNIANKRMAVALLDLDHFKLINDTYGHDAGDYTLQLLCKTINDNIRGTDLFARFGGEEFVFYIVTSTRDSIFSYFERIRQLIESTYIPYQDKMINITVSIGITEVAIDTDSLETLLKKADRALYQAKNDGRNCCRIV